MMQRFTDLQTILEMTIEFLPFGLQLAITSTDGSLSKINSTKVADIMADRDLSWDVLQNYFFFF